MSQESRWALPIELPATQLYLPASPSVTLRIEKYCRSWSVELMPALCVASRRVTSQRKGAGKKKTPLASCITDYFCR